jgi:hypothetical protein
LLFWSKPGDVRRAFAFVGDVLFARRITAQKYRNAAPR